MTTLMSGDVGMSTMITALTTGENAITGTNLWTEVASLAPLVLTLFIFAFGIYKLGRLLRGGSKGKLKF